MSSGWKGKGWHKRRRRKVIVAAATFHQANQTKIQLLQAIWTHSYRVEWRNLLLFDLPVENFVD